MFRLHHDDCDATVATFGECRDALVTSAIGGWSCVVESFNSTPAGHQMLVAHTFPGSSFVCWKGYGTFDVAMRGTALGDLHDAANSRLAPDEWAGARFEN